MTEDELEGLAVSASARRPSAAGRIGKAAERLKSDSAAFARFSDFASAFRGLSDMKRIFGISNQMFMAFHEKAGPRVFSSFEAIASAFGKDADLTAGAVAMVLEYARRDGA